MTKSTTFLSLLLLSFSTILPAGEGVHWSYSGEDGPEHWGELSPEFSRCSDGQNQSPVDLVADLSADLPELVFQYHGTPVRETNNGHTIMLSVAPGNYLEVPSSGEQFQLLQGHFHSPSEHTVNGEHLDMEIHLVHANDDGQLVVVGIMIEEGEEDPMLNRIWSFMPEQVGETTESPLTVFEAGILPPTREYFKYNGSLTTPPCSEGVSWIVLHKSLTASPEQVARFKDRVGQTTNRPIQPRNSRVILD